MNDLLRVWGTGALGTDYWEKQPWETVLASELWESLLSVKPLATNPLVTLPLTRTCPG